MITTETKTENNTITKPIEADLSKVEASIQTLIEKIRTSYNVQLQEGGKAIDLRVDGLCENPGAMHIGLFASQGDTCLFAEHVYVGHGTCNEAEYIAVKAGLTVLKTLYPEPKVPVQVYSDSQLVTKQLNGVWRATGRMQSYCLFLLKLRKTFPYSIAKVPRTQNQIADSLAQKYILKNSGRCMTLEHGRFNVTKQVPAAVKRSDTFNALTSKEFRDYLTTNNMNRDLLDLVHKANEGDGDEALQLAAKLRTKAAKIFATAPKTNEMVAQWVSNTAAIIEKSIDLIESAIEKGDAVDLQYIIEELCGAEASESDMFSTQVGALRSGMAAYQTIEGADAAEAEEA